MKKKNNHFQSDNNLNDTGRLCEKKLIVAVTYVILSCTKVRLARFCPGDNVLAKSQSPSVLNTF